jgi:acid phosphatase
MAGMNRSLRFFIIALLLSALSCGENSNLSSSLPSVHFFAFGDAGTGDANQRAVADQAHAVCSRRGCDFGLFLGDNFYDTGVASVQDPQWQTKYRDMYEALQIPLYALLGNHDWDPPANPQVEIDFDLQDLDPLWRMPGYFYSFRFPEQGGPLLEIFVINSNNFASDSSAQQWLAQALAASQSPWKMVAFHHPIFTNGPHPPDEKEIYPALRPLICGKVQLLLSGHNHLFSHMKDNLDSCGYDQLVIGTGGQTLYDPTASSNVVYSEKNFGLGFFEVTRTQLTVHFIRSDGTEAYTVSWQKS